MMTRRGKGDPKSDLLGKRILDSRRRSSTVALAELGCRLDEDYPVINWSHHTPMADLWLEIDERHRTDRPIAEQLARVAYDLCLSQRWPRVDCLAMVPGLAVSSRARLVFESLGLPGMRFLGFRVNEEPFFLFYTDRRIDCLDRTRSEIRYFASSPQRIKDVTLTLSWKSGCRHVTFSPCPS